ncbi:retrovirus-related pol polyprotein from transposon TNT 1-94 [Tanacetum coccineum]
MWVESINKEKYILVIVDDYSRFTWVMFLRMKDETPENIIKFVKQAQTFVARTLQQNVVVERRNRTLVEAARTMLIFFKCSLFLWAEAVSAASKPSSKKDLDLLFQPMFDEYFKPPLSAVSLTISAATLPTPDTARASLYITIDHNAPFPSTSPNNETTESLIISTNVKQPNNEEDAYFESDTFTNPFAPLENSLAVTSSKIIDTSNMHTFQQPPINTKRWTKDHPIVTIISDLSKLVSTR